MVVACLALLIALGGTSYAAIKLPKNSVGTKQLKTNAVTSPKVKNNSITGSDILESSLGRVNLRRTRANAPRTRRTRRPRRTRRMRTSSTTSTRPDLSAQVPGDWMKLALRASRRSRTAGRRIPMRKRPPPIYKSLGVSTLRGSSRVAPLNHLHPPSRIPIEQERLLGGIGALRPSLTSASCPTATSHRQEGANRLDADRRPHIPSRFLGASRGAHVANAPGLAVRRPGANTRSVD